MRNLYKSFSKFLIKIKLAVPKKYMHEFRRETTKENLNRVSIIGTVLLIIECVLYFFLPNMLNTKPTIMVFLIFLVIVLPLIWYARIKSETVNLKFANLIQYIFAAGCMAFGIYVAVSVYNEADFIHLYILMVFSVAVFFVMRPYKSLILFTSGYLLFVVLFPHYVIDSEIRFVVDVNLLASNVVAWLMSIILLRAKVSLFLNKKALHKKNLQLIDLNKKDSMTGLFNHEFSFSLLKDEMLKAKELEEPISLIIIDIDDFKNINDSYGHLTGDYVIKNFADVLKFTVRKTDLVGRYGGEEFIIIMPNTDIDEARHLSERIQKATAENLYNDIAFTVSGGISTNYGEDIEEFIRITDKKLYIAKEAGKNRFISELD